MAEGKWARAADGKERRHRLFPALGVFWALLFLAAFFLSIRPGFEVSLKASPPGWRSWGETGSVKALAVMPDGVYCGGPRGLFRIGQEEILEAVPVPGLRKAAVIHALLRDRDGGLWVGHDDGLSLCRDGRWISLSRKRELPDGSVRAMIAASDGRIWIATTAGAARLSREGPWTRDRIETLTRADGLIHDLLSAVLEDREGGIWFGTHAAPAGGLSRLKDGRWTHWTLDDGLPHADIVCLLIDREGRLWAGCGLYDRGGAAVFVQGADGWRMSGTLPLAELAGPKVRSLWEDGAGRIWIGSEFEGLAVRLGDRTLRILTTDDGLAGQEIMAIAGTPDGAVWLGTIDGLTRIGPEAAARLFPEPAPGRIP